jgi:pyruvate-formate lyase-activating enzyme
LLAGDIPAGLQRWPREVLSDLKRRGIAVAMNTNGLTLTEDIAASAKLAKTAAL